MPSFRVFVGSTYEDLQLHRAAVLEALHKLEIALVGIEYFGSKTQPPLEACLAAVAKSTAYLGIFAMRYGSIDPTHGAVERPEKDIETMPCRESLHDSLARGTGLTFGQNCPILKT